MISDWVYEIINLQWNFYGDVVIATNIAVELTWTLIVSGSPDILRHRQITQAERLTLSSLTLTLTHAHAHAFKNAHTYTHHTRTRTRTHSHALFHALTATPYVPQWKRTATKTLRSRRRKRSQWPTRFFRRYRRRRFAEIGATSGEKVGIWNENSKSGQRRKFFGVNEVGGGQKFCTDTWS